MSDALELFEVPRREEMYMIVGFRQWADAGSISSGLPDYLVQKTGVNLIGQLKPDGFYLFQIPGTHDLVRPVVKFHEGVPESLSSQSNHFYFTENSQRGIVIFLGDEPHMDVERYVRSILEAAKRLNVRRIIGLGGVYGELPFDKERMISCNISMTRLRAEMGGLAVNLTDYHGGASIGSYLCRRAGAQGIEYVGLYGFVPMYDFSNANHLGSSIRIENDYMAWLGIMRRINYMLKVNFDVSELVENSARLVKHIQSKVDEIDQQAPHLGVREYFKKLGEEFNETPFIPLDDVWEQNLKHIFDKFDEEEGDPG